MEDANATQLTYAWHHLDIFGEIVQDATIFSSCWNKLKHRCRSVFYNERSIPKPRKHLLQNSKGPYELNVLNVLNVHNIDDVFDLTSYLPHQIL